MKTLTRLEQGHEGLRAGKTNAGQIASGVAAQANAGEEAKRHMDPRLCGDDDSEDRAPRHCHPRASGDPSGDLQSGDS
ncbi:MAG: hypothetical protein ACTHKB_10670, partial [Burkholderiaceae bacterium]